MINIFIVDDHILLRKGIRALLGSQPDFNVLAEAGRCDEVLEQLKDYRFDLVMLDISMPDGDGLELIPHLRTAQPAARVIVLTMHTDERYAMRALKAGAHGYMTKDSTPEVMITAIRRVLNGALFLSPNIAESLALRVARQEEAQSLLATLSSRELEIFRMLVDGKTASEIAGTLDLSVKTVSKHKLGVLRKLNLRNQTDLVVYAVRHQFMTP